MKNILIDHNIESCKHTTIRNVGMQVLVQQGTKNCKFSIPPCSKLSHKRK